MAVFSVGVGDLKADLPNINEVATPLNEGLNVRVLALVPRTSVQKMPEEHTNRLIAAAAACIAVLYRGRVP